MSQADQIIAKLGLSPHPEGGWYRQTWLGPTQDGRASGTAILFLLKKGERSHWHRVDADEIWIWNAGAPLRLSIGLTAYEDSILGPDVLAGQNPQGIVPKDYWQAAESLGDYTLVSCTVSPGFRFEGFELAPEGWSLPKA